MPNPARIPAPIHKQVPFLLLLAALVCAPAASAQTSSSQQQPADTSTASSSASKDTAANSTPKKVYTNDDLRGMERADVSVVGKGEKPAKTAPTANEKKDQAYWHNRAQKLRDQIADVDRQIAQFNHQEQAATGSSSAPPPPGAYTLGARSRASAQLERLQNKRAALLQQMDQLEEEARRADVPAGWLR